MHLHLMPNTECTISTLSARPIRDEDDPVWDVTARLEIDLGSAGRAAGIIDVAGDAVGDLAGRVLELADDQSLTLGVKFGAAELIWEFESGISLSFKGSVSGRASLVLEPGKTPKLKVGARGRLDEEQLGRLQELSMTREVAVRTRKVQQDMFVDDHIQNFKDTVRRGGVSVSMSLNGGKPVEIA